MLEEHDAIFSTQLFTRFAAVGNRIIDLSSLNPILHRCVIRKREIALLTLFKTLDFYWNVHPTDKVLSK